MTKSLIFAIIVLFGLCSYSAVANLPHDQELQLFYNIFKDWTTKFNKPYGIEEMAVRFMNWKSNYDTVQEINAKGLDYTLEMNDFGDMTNEEFSALHLGFDADAAAKLSNDRLLQSTGDDHDDNDDDDDDYYDDDDETLLNAARNGTLNATKKFLPRTIDWRKSRAVSSVKNQGQCGGCWSFAAAGALEGLYAIKNKKLVGLSVQQMIDCANSNYGNNGCSGGIMTGAYQYTNKHGIEPAANYEYTASVGACRQNPRRVLFKNKGHREVPVNNWRALKRAVAQQPVSVGISASSQAVQLFKSGVITTGCSTNLDHGVLIVGYGVTAKGLGYWIVKNSWGPSWGLGGYMHVAMGAQNGGKGVCGINQMASYPTL